MISLTIKCRAKEYNVYKYVLFGRRNKSYSLHFKVKPQHKLASDLHQLWVLIMVALRF